MISLLKGANPNIRFWNWHNKVTFSYPLNSNYVITVTQFLVQIQTHIQPVWELLRFTVTNILPFLFFDRIQRNPSSSPNKKLHNHPKNCILTLFIDRFFKKNYQTNTSPALGCYLENLLPFPDTKWNRLHPFITGKRNKKLHKFFLFAC